MDREILVGVGLGLLRRAAVHFDAHDFFPNGLFFAENLNRVAGGLAHFFAVYTRDLANFGADLRLRKFEGWAVLFVEFHRHVPRELDVLLLILAYGNNV